MNKVFVTMAIAVALGAVYACNNTGGASGDVGDSTPSPSIQSTTPNPPNDKVGSRQGDTASYDRMAQHTDSTQ